MLPFTATQTVPDDRRVTIELPDVQPGTLVTVLVIPAGAPVTSVDERSARRKANGWLLDHVGNLVMARDPRLLSDGRRSFWRMAAYVSHVHRQPFGPIGFIDVDAATGEVISSMEVAQELRRYGERLERHPLGAGV